MATMTTLTEVKKAKLGIFVPIMEATDGVRPLGLDEKARVARCILITEGLGNLRDKNYYTAEAIESCPGVFEKAQFYIDHPSRTEEEDRPERSIRDLAGYFRNVSVGSVKDRATGEDLRACFADLVFSESEAGTLAMGQVKTAIKFQKDGLPGKDVYAGISINAGGLSEAGTIDGMDVNMVREIHDAFSADIVTKPARGGKFLSLMQEAAKTAAWLRARGRGRTLHKEGASMKTKVKQGKGKLSEAERARLGVLRKKDPTKLSEAERTELRGLKKKLREMGAVPRMPGTKTEGENETHAGEDEAAEGEDDADSEAEDGAAEDDAEAEDGAAEGEDDAEEEGEQAGGSPMGSMMQLAENMLGKMKSYRKMAGYSSEDEGGEAEGEDQIGPVDSEDPQALLADIKQDLAAIADHLGGMGGDEEYGDDEGPMGGEDEGEGEDEAGHAMKYSCSSCGEENTVLPPKGYGLVKAGESLKFLKGKGSKVLREAYQRLYDRYMKKETRFAKTNGHLRETLEENVRLKTENVMLKREKRAGKALREAGVPADVLSKDELLALDPSQWGLAIKTARRSMKLEAKVTESIPAGSGGRIGDGKGRGVREAKAAFDSSYSKKH